MEKPLASSNPMLHFQIRTPSTGVRPSTTLFHGLLEAARLGERAGGSGRGRRPQGVGHAQEPQDGAADARTVPIVPRRFHKQASRQAVARLRDRPAAVPVPAGVLPGHQPQIRHQPSRRRKPLHIVQLGEQQHRGQRVDAPEAPQPVYPGGKVLNDRRQSGSPWPARAGEPSPAASRSPAHSPLPRLRNASTSASTALARYPLRQKSPTLLSCTPHEIPDSRRAQRTEFFDD